MVKTILKIDGMMCSMCEAHINDVIRRNFDVKKVRADRKKKEAIIESKTPLDEGRLKSVIDATGYKLISIER